MTDFDAQVAGVAVLADPVRRALYLYVAASADAVSREQAAAGVGIQRALAAFHLEKLAEEGLLEFEFRRLSGRTGPGAGRPAKLYRRSSREIDVSIPPREYDLAGRLLADAISASERSGRPVRQELESGSRSLGATLGAQAADAAGRRASKSKRTDALIEVLRRHGFEPRREGKDVVLANCPFHALAQEHTELICGMNLHLLTGLRDELGDVPEPRLEPEAGHCCVKFCS